MNNKGKIEILERVNDNYYKTIDKLSGTMSNISFGSIDDLKTLKNSANEIYNIQKLIEMNVKLQKDLMDEENNLVKTNTTSNENYKIDVNEYIDKYTKRYVEIASIDQKVCIINTTEFTRGFGISTYIKNKALNNKDVIVITGNQYCKKYIVNCGIDNSRVVVSNVDIKESLRGQRLKGKTIYIDSPLFVNRNTKELEKELSELRELSQAEKIIAINEITM